MEKLIIIVLVVAVIKSITIGSEFNFFMWLKHKKKYTQWYFNRPTFPL